MSVLQRKELEESPLADLHAIASELGIEGYRGLRRDDLVGAIVGGQGGEDDSANGDDRPSAEEDDAPKPRRRRSRGGRGRGSRAQSSDRDNDDRDTGSGDEADSEDEDEDEAEQEVVAGVLDILQNGSGFLRGEGDDAYVSQAQIRRCELRAGDQVSGRLRPARRNERHPSLTRVEQVNGKDAEPPEERPLFSDLTAVHPTDRLTMPDALSTVPIGRGARVAVAGGPGAGATRLLREIAGSLSGTDGIEVSVALVGARPEEVTDWKGDDALSVTGGAFDEPIEAQTQAAELAVERSKRVAERGGDAVVVIDSLEALPGGAARRLFGAARKLDGAGTLTVIAATGMAWEPQRQASTRIALDSPQADGTPVVAESRSGTLRADLLA